MKKIFLIAPAFFFLACGGEAAEDALENLENNGEEILADIIEEVVEPTKEDEILAYLEEKGWDGVKHESGMYIVTDEPGEGDERPALSDEVTIFYGGYLLDGTKFDGTAEEPATFPLTRLIDGWQIGIPTFGKGGKGKLIIPSDLAYGDMDNGDIPGGSTLMFEIELIDWAAPAM